MTIETQARHNKAISRDTWSQLLEFARVRMTLVLTCLHLLLTVIVYISIHICGLYEASLCSSISEGQIYACTYMPTPSSYYNYLRVP